MHDSHRGHGLGCPPAPLMGEAGEDRSRESVVKANTAGPGSLGLASLSLRHSPWTPQPFRIPCPQGQTSLPTVGQQAQGTKEPMAGQEGCLSILWQDTQGPSLSRPDQGDSVSTNYSALGTLTAISHQENLTMDRCECYTWQKASCPCSLCSNTEALPFCFKGRVKYESLRFPHPDSSRHRL